MFAMLLAPFAAFWAADNQSFFDKMTDAEWEYVGYQARPAEAADGAKAMTLEVGGQAYILFKQKPLGQQPIADLADNTNLR
ncbi:MAG: hypothetical protein HOB37_09435 [Rhodospirillaceae bacterium]|nr:hypothetical protein [Rhodospirillaceae bacterium]MBT3908674.1 hypothetical protein [Rhodospirillaceae bacterium]MBT6087238.1 hypothetical protein [Rhodospirillaceae bacterium]MBT6608673.1 hypothetical protein [Rhodospirillaceae bacterium]MBT6884633.1 hypothetical protein [Rhodospirillaceae bacterium]